MVEIPPGWRVQFWCACTHWCVLLHSTSRFMQSCSYLRTFGSYPGLRHLQTRLARPPWTCLLCRCKGAARRARLCECTQIQGKQSLHIRLWRSMPNSTSGETLTSHNQSLRLHLLSNTLYFQAFNVLPVSREVEWYFMKVKHASI